MTEEVEVRGDWGGVWGYVMDRGTVIATDVPRDICFALYRHCCMQHPVYSVRFHLPLFSTAYNPENMHSTRQWHSES